MRATPAEVDEIQTRYCHWSRLLRCAQRDADRELIAFYGARVTETEKLADAIGVSVRYLAQHTTTTTETD